MKKDLFISYDNFLGFITGIFSDDSNIKCLKRRKKMISYKNSIKHIGSQSGIDIINVIFCNSFINYE